MGRSPAVGSEEAHTVGAMDGWTTPRATLPLLVLLLVMLALPAMPALAQTPPAGAEGSAAAGTRAEAPSLPSDLPRRDTRDVPLFAGPATLRLSGEDGVYAWGEVRFGAREVRARVSLAPADTGCVARLRLSRKDEVVADEWFAAPAGVEALDTRDLEVDYATGSLALRSDCPSWSLRLVPLDDPEVELVLRERTYRVRGRTLPALRAQTHRLKGEWAGYTDWTTAWTFDWRGAADGRTCSVTRGSVEVEARLTLPRWKPPANVDPALVRGWERFLERLRMHELGHVTIALQGAAAIDDRLDAGLEARDCTRVRKRANAAATRIFERYEAASDRYDEATRHGLAQGTRLR